MSVSHESDVSLVDVSMMTLDELESHGSSALGAALNRVADERRNPRDFTASHRDHTDSHSSSPW
jgi:hypothetical protein